MAKSFVHIHRGSVLVIVFALLAAACSPEPVSPSLSPTVQSETASSPTLPTSTPPLPTLTPTATPLAEPKDILHSAFQDFALASPDSNVQQMVIYPQFILESDVSGHRSTYIFWWSPDGYDLRETITIAQQPWENLPAERFPGSENYSSLPATEVEAPPVGQSSQAFEYGGDPSQLSLSFIKGNALVNLYARGFTIDDLADLAKRIEAQLPEMFPEPAPLSFPDQLDQQTFDQYFKEVTIAGLKSDGGVEPANSFPFDRQFFVWDYVPVSDTVFENVEKDFDTPVWETAVVDLQTGKTVFRYAAIGSSRGTKPGCASCNLTPGQYEFKLAVNGVLVASIPFEITE